MKSVGILLKASRHRFRMAYQVLTLHAEAPRGL